MTYIKYPDELGRPVPSGPNWQIEAIRLSALLHEAMIRAEIAEVKLDNVLGMLSKLFTCVEAGCYCSELRMATVMDEASAMLAELD